MNGRGCRNKGIRTEYFLRDYLRERGYEAYRVPLSGASEGYKYDVVATKNEIKYTFEIKARKDSFDTIYSLYYHNRTEDKVYRVSTDKGFIAISTYFENVKQMGHLVNFPKPTPDAHPKTIERLWRLDTEWRQGADFLVIKDNNKHMLFIKYWPS